MANGAGFAPSAFYPQHLPVGDFGVFDKGKTGSGAANEKALILAIATLTWPSKLTRGAGIQAVGQMRIEELAGRTTGRKERV